MNRPRRIFAKRPRWGDAPGSSGEGCERFSELTVKDDIAGRRERGKVEGGR
jgi:hypothetical protein